jgi:predicted DNA-binding transcriptional regulator AlpA
MQTHPDKHLQSILANSAFLRLHQIIGDPRASPPVPALIPISKSTLYRAIARGVFPPPSKQMSPGCSLWHTEAVIAALEDRS